LKLESLGYSSFFEEEFRAVDGEGLVPGRVTSSHTHVYRVSTETDELLAEVSGKLRHEARGPEDFPAVGDWVAVAPRADEGRATIHLVLPRRTAFVRRAAGGRDEKQILAANVDTVFLIAGLDGDYNPRRIERALVLAWDSGAEPVVVLNKADLSTDVENRRREMQAAAEGVPVLVISAREGTGLESLAPYLVPGRTIVLLGSSGVGKSTLANKLLGQQRLPTSAVREHDQRGRHTTTHREILPLPGGALLLDTPGLREIQLWADDAALGSAFSDIAALAAGCRFHDCRHQGEPGCAVEAAVAAGELSEERLRSHHKLERELQHQRVREDVGLQRAQKVKWKAIHKAARKHRPRE
jgi:ribosome biogenesis GTPase / thiamine phosphate phosphatase